MTEVRNLEFVELHDGIAVGKATGLSLNELRVKLKAISINRGAVIDLNGQQVQMVMT